MADDAYNLCANELCRTRINYDTNRNGIDGMFCLRMDVPKR